MNFRDIIKNTDLIEIEQNYIKLDEHSAMYLRANRVEANENSVISEYIFLKMDGNLINKISNDNIDRFKDIQDTILSDIFFSYDSDLRWNLYFILVIDSRENLPEGFNSQLIENDEDYARKFIFTMDETIEFINRGWIYSKDSEAINKKFFSPLNHWIQSLEVENLAGCLTRDYRSSYIDEYINGIGIYSDETLYSNENDVTEENKEELMQIKRVNFEGYRKHCFKNIHSIETVKVNLINGTNGSGKTSLLEIIELSLTNNIRRINNYKDKIDDDISNVSVESLADSGKLKVFTPGQSQSVYKKLEESWYGVPLSRAQTTINNNFHRFNYFDSEEAFIFALEESDNKNHNNFNYYDGLSKLVYGDQLVNIEKNFLNFKKHFIEKEKLIRKQLQEQESKFNSLQDKVNLKSSELVNELPIDDFNDHLNQVYLNKLVETLDKKTIIEMINQLKITKDNLYYINENKYNIDPLTIKNLLKEKNFSELELVSLNKEIRIIEEKIVKLKEDATVLNTSVKKVEFKLNNVNLSQKELINTFEIWNQISKLILNETSVKEYKISSKKLENNNKLITLIEKIKKEFIIISNFNKKIENYKTNIDINYLEKNLEELNEETEVISKEIVENEKYMEDANRFLLDIKHLGIKYLESTNTNICPMCNTHHSNKIDLLNNINFASKSVNNSEKILSFLKQRKFDIEESIGEITDELKRNKEITQQINIIDNLYESIYKSQLINLYYNDDKKERFLFLQKLINDLDNYKNLSLKIEYEIDRLINSGITKSGIIISEKFINTNIFYKEFISMSDNNMKFNEYIINKEITLKEKELKYNEDINRYKMKFGLLSRDDSDSGNLLIEKSKLKLELDNKISYLIKMMNQIESLESFSIPIDSRLDSWSNKLEKVLLRLEIWIEQINDEKELNFFNKNISEVKKEIYLKNKEYRRCKKAVDVLGDLPLLQNYVVEFVESHVDKIERFFRLLHTPREFSELKITKEGIVMKRNSDNTLTKAHQMSNGQRAAFALSVLFTLHLAAKDAPKLIIMDEPVANMDDLHLLNLLDVLRDFAIQGHQIFFTTANPYVSNLFRRKFSFLKHDFKQFEFSRSGDAPTSISERIYTPYSESPINNRMIKYDTMQ